MWQYNQSPNSNELTHHGIMGMKWGVRRYQNPDGSLTAAGKKRQAAYRSTGIQSFIARKKNEKVDKSFKKWDENSKKRSYAIELGKKANQSKMAYESNKTDKALKTQYKSDELAYKKALKSNTTYRKGQVKHDVLQDASRKYLSEAKKVKKKLDLDPSNKDLQKQYNKLMSKHDIERSKARRAPEVASKRSLKKASMKRTMTMTATAVVGTAAVSAGMYFANKYLSNHDVRLDGVPVRIKGQDVETFKKVVDAGKQFMQYIY